MGGVGTITGCVVGTKVGRGVGTIIGGGVGNITGDGVGSIIGTDGDGNGVGTRAGEGDCKGALYVSGKVGGVDVDGFAGGTFIR
ncbi:hypothetical protein DEO72_LG10g1469 [Vigna unguiculata]|uniref:Uncharacterized protein n=1 Tax=Vigna unguiculata TaxID=3917 RepID=A0A4D6NBK1_VIGUN|nr:hypothetical protein DEO72_LG10g1469 [Vigna unguiculata]